MEDVYKHTTKIRGKNEAKNGPTRSLIMQNELILESKLGWL